MDTRSGTELFPVLATSFDRVDYLPRKKFCKVRWAFETTSYEREMRLMGVAQACRYIRDQAAYLRLIFRRLGWSLALL